VQLGDVETVMLKSVCGQFEGRGYLVVTCSTARRGCGHRDVTPYDKQIGKSDQQSSIQSKIWGHARQEFFTS